MIACVALLVRVAATMSELMSSGAPAPYLPKPSNPLGAPLLMLASFQHPKLLGDLAMEARDMDAKIPVAFRRSVDESEFDLRPFVKDSVTLAMTASKAKPTKNLASLASELRGQLLEHGVGPK